MTACNIMNPGLVVGRFRAHRYYWYQQFNGQTGTGVHTASCTMGTGSFPGGKRPGRDVEHRTHLEPRLKKEQNYTSTPLWAFLACSGGNFTNNLMLKTLNFVPKKCFCVW